MRQKSGNASSIIVEVADSNEMRGGHALTSNSFTQVMAYQQSLKMPPQKLCMPLDNRAKISYDGPVKRE